MENDEVKPLQNMNIQCHNVVEARRSDIIVVSKKKNKYISVGSTRGLSLEMRVLARAHAQLLNMLYISTHLSVPHGENI